MKLKKLAAISLSLLLIAVLGLSSCAPKTETKGPIVVASKIDTEGSLLGSMIRLLLEKEGFAVTDKVQLGATGVVRKALLAGEIDIYPEYTGNAAFFHDEADSPIWKDAAAGWKRAAELDAPLGLVWLRSAPANNTWAIAPRKDLAGAEGLATMSDLGRYVRAGGRLKLAGSEEFVTSAAALPAFQAAYGF
ncbi:MAG TPA: ABC transporter substrate-binding protein, partial [Spirochaetaceae bacterium]|nr:ABC transporter substrate-binding protein [Spirochaetaceae bacterium]